MVQVIQLKNKRQPTDWGQALVGAIGIGADAYGKYKEKAKTEKANAESSKYYEDLTGKKLPANMDPKLKQLAFAEAFKEQSQKRANEEFDKTYGFSPKEEPKNPYDDMATPNQAKGQKPFNANDPSSWTDAEVDKFRAIVHESPKAKTLAKTAENEFERRKELKKSTVKYNKDVGGLKGALETIDRMEKIGSKNNLGVGSSTYSAFDPETRKDIGEYEQLGKSLISYASTIPIRNRQEFETLSHDIFDSSLSDAKRAGILESMKRIIRNSIASYTNPNALESEEGGAMQQPQERPPLTSFMR